MTSAIDTSDENEAILRGVVWHDSVDQGAWVVQVWRGDDPESGRLLVWKSDDLDAPILDQPTGHMMYGAIFGPDVDDVAMWKERALEAIDSR